MNQKTTGGVRGGDAVKNCGKRKGSQQILIQPEARTG